jgi:hypothetical protein
MSISGVGSYNSFAASALTGASSLAKSQAASGSAGAQGGDSGSALDFLTKYLNETPAQRMTDAWLKRHHLTEQQLESMPPDQQDAIRKQMADDIKKQIQEKSGGLGGNADITA